MPKRKKPRMPPLSVLDKLTYHFLPLVVIIISFSLSFIPGWVHNFTSFTNNHVFAVVTGSSSLFLVIPTPTIFCISFCFWIVKFKGKRPIFGKRGIIYGEQIRSIYPLFGQQHKPKSINDLSKNRKMCKRFASASLAIILILSFVISAFGIYSRYELTDISIVKYDCLNHVSNQYPFDTVTQVEIGAYYHHQARRIGYYTFSYTFFFNNRKDIQFTYSEFCDLESVKKINSILHAVPKKDSGIQNLDALRREYHFNDQDWAVIQKLFSI